MLRIVKLTDRTGLPAFTAKDVFTEEILSIGVPIKLLMNFGKEVLVEGDECVAEFGDLHSTSGYVVTPSSFKMSLTNDCWIEQKALATRYEEEIGAYTTDQNWFHRPS